MKNFEFKIDWNAGLMSLLKKGLKQGMWFQRMGEKFFVPAENIQAYFDSSMGQIVIYFHSDNPNTMATYVISSYGIRWALEKDKLENIYKEEIYYD